MQKKLYEKVLVIPIHKKVYIIAIYTNILIFCSKGQYTESVVIIEYKHATVSLFTIEYFFSYGYK